MTINSMNISSGLLHPSPFYSLRLHQSLRVIIFPKFTFIYINRYTLSTRITKQYNKNSTITSNKYTLNDKGIISLKLTTHSFSYSKCIKVSFKIWCVFDFFRTWRSLFHLTSQGVRNVTTTKQGMLRMTGEKNK